MGFLSRLFGSKENSNPIDNLTFTNDQKARRAKSEEFCKSKNIPIYSDPYAMYFEPESEITIRTKDEVIDRTLGLCSVFLKAEKLYQESLPEKDSKFKLIAKFGSEEMGYLYSTDPTYDDFLLKYDTISKLTPNEKEFITLDNPTQQQRSNAYWRTESINVMLWALGHINFLTYPNKTCDESGSAEINIHTVFSFSEQDFRDKSKLRSKSEILDEADLILRLHWACVNARIKNELPPGDLNPSVIFERHWTLNWLTNYMNQDWDNVTTDT